MVLLGSDSNVVHTYAAVAVERLLAQKVSSSVPSNPFMLKASVLQFCLTKVRVDIENWDAGRRKAKIPSARLGACSGATAFSLVLSVPET